jgi:hypothetical protein
MSWGSRLRAFAVFCFDFVVGDDWRLALGVVAGLLLTALLAHAGRPAAWTLPVVAGAALAYSLRRALAASRR